MAKVEIYNVEDWTNGPQFVVMRMPLDTVKTICSALKTTAETDAFIKEIGESISEVAEYTRSNRERTIFIEKAEE